jgi:hypothetical protein
MSTKTKLALAIALVLSTSSAVLAAPRYSTQGYLPSGEQNWMDRASDGGHAPGDTNGF